MNHVFESIIDRQQFDAQFDNVFRLDDHEVTRIRKALAATCDRLGLLPDTVHRRAVMDEALRMHKQGRSVAACVEHGRNVAEGVARVLKRIAERKASDWSPEVA